MIITLSKTDKGVIFYSNHKWFDDEYGTEFCKTGLGYLDAEELFDDLALVADRVNNELGEELLIEID